MLFEIEKLKKATTVPTARAAAKLCQVQQHLTQAFGRLEKGCDYPYASGGVWSNHDLIEYILNQIGPARLTACTWSMAGHAVEKLIRLLHHKTLYQITMLVDWRVQVRTPEALPLAKHKFTDIRVTSCHAKVFVLENTDWSVSVVGSANFTNNPRIEAGHLSTNPTVATFHREWIESEINNTKPFGVDMRKGQKDGRK